MKILQLLNLPESLLVNLPESLPVNLLESPPVNRLESQSPQQMSESSTCHQMHQQLMYWPTEQLQWKMLAFPPLQDI